jgi:Flp pilus assembly protein TadG
MARRELINNMDNNSISFFKDENGSILLETVIAVPLFMLLIGGIMWSGQLIYDKQKLVIADRYVVWNAGNRYAQNNNNAQSDVQNRFFPDATAESVTVPAPQKSDSANWSYSVQSHVKLDVTMPDWTRGMLLADAIMTGRMQDVPDIFKPAKVTTSLYGRDLTSDGQHPGGHYVVMRSPNYSGTRNQPVDAGGYLQETYLNVKPEQITNEPWAPFLTQ